MVTFLSIAVALSMTISFVLMTRNALQAAGEIAPVPEEKKDRKRFRPAS